MTREARVVVENGCYHIMTRGNQKQCVFSDYADYNEYLSLLTKYKKRFKFKLYGFCLMPNHVHLVIEVKNPSNLNKIMRGLNLSYTLFFNAKYKKVGHLWQDRYKSKVIGKDAYLLECISYIEQNPVRASLVPEVSKYLWSSYNFRINKHKILDDMFSLL
ncbi:MAG: transposase [Candidatus Omnitrophica bacterium]|nr:transposase [Candidatus Omnitrophota bacterium]